MHQSVDREKWQELVERFPELGADMIAGLVDDINMGCEDYDAVYYCGKVGDDDDGNADFTSYGGWGREEQEDDRDDGGGLNRLR